MKNKIFPQILKTILDQFRPQYVWFLVHLYIG